MAYRDMSIPYTTEELENLRQMFRSCSTFKGNSVSTNDFEHIFEQMKWEKVPEETTAYKEYFNKYSNGRLEEEEFLRLCASIHSPKAYGRQLAENSDRDGNGFISTEEFKRILDLIKIHDDTLNTMNYEDFIGEADINKDGRVSIEECAKWIENRMS